MHSRVFMGKIKDVCQNRQHHHCLRKYHHLNTNKHKSIKYEDKDKKILLK
jgi:hypothetical protein